MGLGSKKMLRNSTIVAAKNPDTRLFGFNCGVSICLHVRIHVCVSGGAREPGFARPTWRPFHCGVDIHLHVRLHVCVNKAWTSREPRFAWLVRRLLSLIVKFIYVCMLALMFLSRVERLASLASLGSLGARFQCGVHV